MNTYNCSEGMSRLPKDSLNHLGEKYSIGRMQKKKKKKKKRFSKLHLFPNQNKDGNLLELQLGEWFKNLLYRVTDGIFFPSAELKDILKGF